MFVFLFTYMYYLTHEKTYTGTHVKTHTHKHTHTFGHKHTHIVNIRMRKDLTINDLQNHVAVGNSRRSYPRTNLQGIKE